MLPSEFIPTFEYRVENGKMIKEKELNKEMLKATGVVYARVYNGIDVIYIGKSEGKLRNRIALHRKYVNGERKDLKEKLDHYRSWAENKTIVIYACKPHRSSYVVKLFTYTF